MPMVPGSAPPRKNHTVAIVLTAVGVVVLCGILFAARDTTANLAPAPPQVILHTGGSGPHNATTAAVKHTYATYRHSDADDSAPRPPMVKVLSVPEEDTGVKFSVPVPNGHQNMTGKQWAMAAGRARFPASPPPCKVKYYRAPEAHQQAVAGCPKRPWATPLPAFETRCPTGPERGVACSRKSTMPAGLAAELGCEGAVEVCQVDDVATLPDKYIAMWEPHEDVVMPVNARPRGPGLVDSVAGVTASYIVRLNDAVIMMNSAGGVANSRYHITHGYGERDKPGGVMMPDPGRTGRGLKSNRFVRFDRILSLVQLFSNGYIHFTFDTLPRANFVTQFLRENPDVMVGVMSEVAQGLVTRGWKGIIDPGRVFVLTANVYANEVYLPHWYGGPGFRTMLLGVMPRYSYRMVGPNMRAPYPAPGKRNVVLFMLRGPGRRRAINPAQQEALLTAVSDTLAPDFKMEVIIDPPPWEEVAASLAQAVVVIGPHGGQLSNLFLMHPGGHVVEILERTVERVCYVGEAYGSDLTYWQLVADTPAGSFYNKALHVENPEPLLNVLREIGVMYDSPRPLRVV